MNIKLLKQLSFMLVSMRLMTSCTPSLKVTGSWVNKEKVGTKQ